MLSIGNQHQTWCARSGAMQERPGGNSSEPNVVDFSSQNRRLQCERKQKQINKCYLSENRTKIGVRGHEYCRSVLVAIFRSQLLSTLVRKTNVFNARGRPIDEIGLGATCHVNVFSSPKIHQT